MLGKLTSVSDSILPQASRDTELIAVERVALSQEAVSGEVTLTRITTHCTLEKAALSRADEHSALFAVGECEQRQAQG